MKTEKLFSLLVLGGAMLVAQPGKTAENTDPTPVFCSPYDASKPIEENTCVKNAEGKDVPKDGLECCWSTSCEKS